MIDLFKFMHKNRTRKKNRMLDLSQSRIIVEYFLLICFVVPENRNINLELMIYIFMKFHH